MNAQAVFTKTNKKKFVKAIGWDDLTNKLLIFIASLMLLTTFFVGFTIIYLLAFDDNPPIEWYDLHWETDTAYIIDGEDGSGTLVSNFCKYTTSHHDMRGTWINGLEKGANLNLTRSVEPGCYERHIQIPIPRDLPEGEYYLELQAIYQVNPLKERRVMKRTENPIVIVHVETDE